MQAIEFATTISLQGDIAMPDHLKALYGREARIILLVEDESPASAASADRLQRQAHMRDALVAVANAKALADVDDAVAWQRELRSDRLQPGRED